MDLSIRRNENCIIGLPRCNYAFNSTRSCFIGYGFLQSNLERKILSSILKENQIEAVDAGSSFTPAQYAFCTKICSKILTSQFCIILANNDIHDSREVPNANVNMEYGLMLGFNKYVIPFQREEQKLPFNIAALDTIKYNNKNFDELATTAIQDAIKETTINITKDQKEIADTVVDTFLATQETYFSPIDDEGEKALFSMGSNLGFNLLNHFDGIRYVYFGNFVRQRSEIVIWKTKILTNLIEGRVRSFPKRKLLGLIDDKQLKTAEELFNQIEFWLLVANEDEKEKIRNYELKNPSSRVLKIFTSEEVRKDLERINEEITAE